MYTHFYLQSCFVCNHIMCRARMYTSFLWNQVSLYCDLLANNEIRKPKTGKKGTNDQSNKVRCEQYPHFSLHAESCVNNNKLMLECSCPQLQEPRYSLSLLNKSLNPNIRHWQSDCQLRRLFSSSVHQSISICLPFHFYLLCRSK